MEPWEQNGERLKRLYRRKYAEATVEAAAHSRPAAFQEAMRWCFMDDPTELVEYLSGDRHISHNQRIELAWVIQMRAELARPEPGRPTDSRLLELKGWAEDAVVLFKVWKESNAESGINDRGHRGDMRQQCCAFIVALRGGSEADIEAVRELADRPASRRKP
jgi:hypothetical protein